MTRRAFVQPSAALAPVLLVLAAGSFAPARAAESVPCDFVTATGNATTGGRVTFGAEGGVKHGEFWGKLNYKDHDRRLTVESTSITRYAGASSATRVVEGTAKTNLFGSVRFRLTASDNGRSAPHTFRLELENGYTREGDVGKGHVKVHQGNRNSTPPPGFTCGQPSDTTPPSAAITDPAEGSTVSGAVAVAASASDDTEVAAVQFQLDGAPLGPEDTTAPFSASWDTTSSANGSHTLRAVARDTAGNAGTSAPVSVTVSNGSPPDTRAPSVAVTSPASGATVSGAVPVSADATDDVAVVGVQFQLDGAPLGSEDTSAPYSMSWDTTTASNGAHTLSAVARDAAGNMGVSSDVSVTVANAAAAGGDVFVAIVTGPVQWRHPDGSLKQLLPVTSTGQVSSLAFDAARNLYVPHWYAQPTATPGNMIERFDAAGGYLGTFGSGYDCNPSSMDFDAAGNMYVGHADCSGDVLKFDPAGNLVARFDVAVENRGTDHVDLAPDGCTLFYTSRGASILRHDVCANVALPRFNLLPLPDTPYHIVLLPDGGLLVAISFGVARFDAAGRHVQSYTVAGERGNLWGGVDYAGDGTFWASNGFNGNVYRFDLATGAVLASFNTGTGDMTVAGVAVRR